MPAGFETEEQAAERLRQASKERYGNKAEIGDNAELMKVEEEKRKSLKLMQAELRKTDDLDRSDRMNSLQKISAVLKVAGKKTVSESSDARKEYTSAQLNSTKEVGAATLAAAGALAIDAGTDVATGGLTTVPVFSHIKDLASTKAANEMYKAATGKEEDMIKGVDNVIAFVLNFIPGLNSVASPATVAATRITLTERVKSSFRDVKMAAEMVPAVVGNVRDANEAFNQIAAENKRNTARETSAGNMQQVGAAA
jgi:hypothetical protein